MVMMLPPLLAAVAAVVVCAGVLVGLMTASHTGLSETPFSSLQSNTA